MRRVLVEDRVIDIGPRLPLDAKPSHNMLGFRPVALCHSRGELQAVDCIGVVGEVTGEIVDPIVDFDIPLIFEEPDKAPDPRSLISLIGGLLSRVSVAPTTVLLEPSEIIWSEIMENRRKPAPPAAALDINCDCKEYVIDYLAKSFPVRLMAVFTDENGNPRSEPMSDEQGAPVLVPLGACRARPDDRAALRLAADRDRARCHHRTLRRRPGGEVTGRTRRLIVGRDGRQKLQSRSPRANVAETQAFMDGSKRILVFSDAGGPGAATMPILPPRTRPAASISCSNRAGGLMPQSRGLGGPIAPIRHRRRCSGR
jgi:hypothetical protein